MAKTSAKDSFDSQFTSSFSLAASSLSSAVQHHIAGPPFSSSFSPSMPSAAGASTRSVPSDDEAERNVVSDAYGSNAAIGGHAKSSTQNTVFFTTAPLLGSPVQFDVQPVSQDVAAEAENSETTLEQQALQPYNVPVNFSVVAATVRKEALTRLISNSLSLAAAIQEADESAAEANAPECDGEVKVVSLPCSLTRFSALHLADFMHVLDCVSLNLRVCTNNLHGQC